MSMRPLIIAIFLIIPLVSFAQDIDVSAHDPVMIKEGNTYYVYCTGRGISVYSSTDLKKWKKEPPVFQKAPDWTFQEVEGFRGHIWAPDIHHYDDKYYLYYSISSFGKNNSAIGLATNVTLDPSSPDYKWVDEGMIVRSVPGRDLWNAIDPNVVTDEQGYPWMTFGSFWSGMKLVKLIPNRTSLAEPQEWYTVARRERDSYADDRKAGDAAIEAPFIFKKDSTFYLFVSWDYCCRGENSTYKVVVGRSEDIRGPYLDKNGKAMSEGGGSLVIEGDERWAGIGHNSAYTLDGKDYFICHGYDSEEDGRARLIIREMTWSKDGWPVIDRKFQDY